MGVTYERADGEVRGLLTDLLQKHRPDLLNAGVSIELLWAYGGIKKDGQLVLGQCKINSLKDRVEGKADATILLDGDRWNKLPAMRRKALLHHELLHIEAYDGKDKDDAGRPAITSRPGDWNFDGFHEVVDLYGDFSVEVANLSMIAQVHSQLRLPFGVEKLEGKAEPATATPSCDGAVDIDAWRAVPIATVDLDSRTIEAIELAKVTTVGEFQQAISSGDIVLDFDIESSTLDAVDQAVHHLVPHCRICGICDESYYSNPPGLLGGLFVEGESPPLCKECLPFKDGLPEPDGIAAESPKESYVYPRALQQKPLKDPARQLERLTKALADAGISLKATILHYQALADKWPGPEPNCSAPGFRGNPRVKFVSSVQQQIGRIAALKGGAQMIQDEIQKQQALVTAAAEAKAASKASKKGGES